MKTLLRLCALLALFAIVPALPAAGNDAAKLIEYTKERDSLKPQSGRIRLRDIATINLTPEFRYLSPEDAETVLVKIWGNPAGQGSLGLIVPKGFDPLARASWAVVVGYAEDGYVKDDEAQSIDYTKMLATMKKAVADENEQRVKQGYKAIDLVGWALPPRYDAATHKFYWAKEIKFADAPVNTLNYNIRILGRKGILVLNAVASMREIAEVSAATPTVLGMVNFDDGNRYTDFDSGTDKVATYGLAALVLGGIAAKAGFFKVLLVALLAAKKLLIAGGAAAWAFFKKFFKKKKSPFVADATAAPAPIPVGPAAAQTPAAIDPLAPPPPSDPTGST